MRESALAGSFRGSPGPPDVSFGRPRVSRARLGLSIRAGFRTDGRRSRVSLRSQRSGHRLALLRAPARAGGSLTALGRTLRLSVQWTFRLAVARREGDLDFDDFIPLLVAAIALGDGKKFAEPSTRILRRCFVHAYIMTHTVAVVTPLISL
jgi:hypothetical protein